MEGVLEKECSLQENGGGGECSPEFVELEIIQCDPDSGRARGGGHEGRGNETAKVWAWC